MTLDEVCTRREAIKKVGRWLGRGAVAVAGAYTATSLADYLSSSEARADESQAATADVPAVVKMYPWDHVALTREARLPKLLLRHRYWKAEWLERYQTDQRFATMFKDLPKMDAVLRVLTDGNSGNDELKAVMIADSNELVFSVLSSTYGFKTKRGTQIFLCYLNLSPQDAAYLRRTAPDRQ